MSRFLTLFLLIIAVAAGPLSAVQSRSYADALKKAGNKKPVILFCYGANYDDYSVHVYEDYVKNRRSPVSKVLNREIFVVVPIFQQPNDKEKREFNKATGGRGLPGIWSYPSFTIVDGNGTVRGTVRSSDDMADPEKAALALAKVIEDYKEQEKLLDKAERASGSSKKRLIREALDISDVRVPNHGSYDPANNGLVQDLQVMSIASANNHVRSIINNNNFTKLERQMILSAYAGHVRRNKGPIHLLRAIYTEMRNIDPTSSYGAYAEGAIELWVVPHETDTKPASQKQAEDKTDAAADKEAPDKD